MNVTAWACPACRSPLVQLAARYECENGHSYDRAREGYVNLLPNARRRPSGDAPTMLQARRRFLEAGHFRPLYSGLIETVVASVQAGPATLLDLGCGEGFYGRLLMSALDSRVQYYGLDISRAAVRLASKADGSIGAQYAVGNAYRIPMIDSSVTTALKVFSPVADYSLLNALRPGGSLVEVIPAPGHLAEVRQLLYREDRPHDDASSLKRSAVFELATSKRMTWKIRFETPTDAQDLLQMTPYAFRGSDSGKSEVARLKAVTADVEIRVLHVRGCEDPVPR